MIQTPVLLRRGRVKTNTATPSPPSPPGGLGFAGPGTVGHTVNGHTLTTYSGNYTGTASETLTDRHITGWYKPGGNSTASDLLIDKYLDVSSGGASVQFASIGPTVVVDVWAEEKKRSIQFAQTTIQRADVFGNIDGCYVWGDNFTLEDSWVHGQVVISSDPKQGGGPSHSDSIQIASGTHHRITDCWLDNIPWKPSQGFDAWNDETWPHASSAYGNTNQPKGTQVIIIRPGTSTNVISDVVIDGCRISGYLQGHIILVENFDAQNGTTPHPTNITISNCVIDWRGMPNNTTHKILGLGIGCTATWTNNIDHTGAAISLTKATTPRGVAGWSSL